MPTCQVCRISVPAHGALLVHLQMFHKHLTRYDCWYANCYRHFDQFRCFKKHFENTHKNSNDIDESINEPCIQKPSNVESLHCKYQVTDDLLKDRYETIDNENGNEKHDCKNNGTSVKQEVRHLIHTTKEKFTQKIGIFVTKLYSESSMPNTLIQRIIDNVSNLFDDTFLSLIQNTTMSIVNISKMDPDWMSNSLNLLFNNLKKPFDYLSTEYKRVRYFESSKNYIAPVSYTIGYTFKTKSVKSQVRPRMVPVMGAIIPLGLHLKTFFELPDALTSTIQYMKTLSGDSDRVSNIIQTKQWREKLKNYDENDLVLPLFVYNDAFEPNNALGAHSGKLEGVYASCPVIPPECQAQVRNIFLISLFRTKDKKKFGNRATFNPTIQELVLLEEKGIVVKISNENQKIFFVTALILGDNLGIHNMFGFVESFSASHFCRFCKAKKTETHYLCEEIVSLLRTKKNYKIDVKLNDYSSTGIKSGCVFHDIGSFHLIDNHFVDCMHDIIEGLCNFCVSEILFYFCCIAKYFTIEMLNDRMRIFNYGPLYKNKPSQIDIIYVQSKKLKMSASEMLTFVRLLPLMIGDLIPSDNEYWQLFLLLRQIVDIVSSKMLSKNTGQILKVLVAEINVLYIKLTKNNLKPKMHFLTHYPRIFEMSGPFALYSCMRFESKHQDLLEFASATDSRVNLSLTIAKRHQLKFSCRVTLEESILPITVKGTGCSLLENRQFTSFCETNGYSDKIGSSKNVKWLEFKSIVYAVNYVLITSLNDSFAPEFSQIKYIIYDQKDPIFICNKLLNLGFNSHLHAWQIEITDTYDCLKASALQDLLPLWLHSDIVGDLYVILKHTVL